MRYLVSRQTKKGTIKSCVHRFGEHYDLRFMKLRIYVYQLVHTANIRMLESKASSIWMLSILSTVQPLSRACRWFQFEHQRAFGWSTGTVRSHAPVRSVDAQIRSTHTIWTHTCFHFLSQLSTRTLVPESKESMQHSWIQENKIRFFGLSMILETPLETHCLVVSKTSDKQRHDYLWWLFGTDGKSES